MKKNPGKRILKEHRGFVVYTLIITMLCVLFLFLKKDNVVRWVQAAVSTREQEERRSALQEEIRGMQSRIDALTTDIDSLEKFAREEYDFAEPGDVVYEVKQ